MVDDKEIDERVKSKSNAFNRVTRVEYHIIMIYHSDSRTGVPRRGNLAGQVRRLAVIAELVQAGLDYQRRPLSAAQVGFLSRRVLGSLSILARLRLLLLHLRRRRRTLVPVQHHCDSAFIVHNFPRWRLIVQLQCVYRLADYFRDRRNCWEYKEKARHQFSALQQAAARIRVVFGAARRNNQCRCEIRRMSARSIGLKGAIKFTKSKNLKRFRVVRKSRGHLHNLREEENLLG